MDRLEEYNIECILINDNQAQEDELIKEYERNSMDRLISEKEVLKAVSKGCCEWRGVYARCEEGIKAMPSAYKGMTNGEVIKALFHEEMQEQGDVCTYYGCSMRFDTNWWNSPYEPQESEG